jgi:hypothetical protein
MAHHAALRQHRGKIVQREHRMHAGQRQRRRRVDGFDQCMRVRAAHEGRVPHPRYGDVVDETSAPAQQRFVLDAGDAGTDQGRHLGEAPVRGKSSRLSCPASCRASRLGGHRASIIGMAGTIPAMTGHEQSVIHITS